MRSKHIMLGMAIFAMLIFYSYLAHAQVPTINVSTINQSINSTAAYINMVNQSGYLIFYPNLTQAYSYLNQARNQSQMNQPYAYDLLAKARSSAQLQQESIDKYKSESLYILIIFAFLLAILMYVLMRPMKSNPKSRKSPKKVRHLSN